MPVRSNGPPPTLADVDRYWLIALATYGSWLPGSRPHPPIRMRDAAIQPATRPRSRPPGAPYEPPLPALDQYASLSRRSAPFALTQRQAESLLRQLRASARARGWSLCAIAITREQLHAVIGLPVGADLAALLDEVRACGRRALSVRRGAIPESWWAERDARRRLFDAPALRAGMREVRDQPRPLVVWVDPAAPVLPLDPLLGDA